MISFLVLLIALFLVVGFGLATRMRRPRSGSSKFERVFPVMWAVLFVLQATALWIALGRKVVNRQVGDRQLVNPFVPVLIIVGVLMGWLWLAACAEDRGSDSVASVLIMSMGMILPFLLASVLAAHTHPSIAACLLPTVAWLIIAVSLSVQETE